MNKWAISKQFDIVSFLEEYVEVRPYIGKEGEYMILCPFCEDHGFTLEFLPNVSQEKGFFSYFKCKTFMLLFDLVSHFSGMTEEDTEKYMLDGVIRSPIDVKTIKAKLGKRQEKIKGLQDIINLPSFQLPPGYIPLTGQQIPYTQYRRLSQEVIDTHRLGWCPPGSVIETVNENGEARRYDYSNYLILPDTDLSGRILYWIARDMLGSQKLRYKNPPAQWKGVGSGSLLWNFYRAKQYKRVIICEGIFSAMRVGMDAVATYGMGLKGLHREWLAFGKFKEVVLMFDCDGTVSEEYVQKWAKELSSLFTVKIARLPQGGDPDNYETSQLRNIVDEAPRFRGGLTTIPMAPLRKTC